jgi:hypothetical protein
MARFIVLLYSERSLLRIFARLTRPRSVIGYLAIPPAQVACPNNPVDKRNTQNDDA